MDSFRRLDSQWRSRVPLSNPIKVPCWRWGCAAAHGGRSRRFSGRRCHGGCLVGISGRLLVDFPQSPSMESGLVSYQRALDFWAGSSELEVAWDRFLNILWKACVPQARPYEIYGSAGNYLPVDVLEQAARIAQTPEDRSHAYYLLARSLQQRGGCRHALRAHPASLREGNRYPPSMHGWMMPPLNRLSGWDRRVGPSSARMTVVLSA